MSRTTAQADVAILDLAKAFDKVSHKGHSTLTYKLRQLVWRGELGLGIYRHYVEPALYVTDVTKKAHSKLACVETGKLLQNAMFARTNSTRHSNMGYLWVLCGIHMNASTLTCWKRCKDPLILLHSLHYSRPVLGAGPSMGLNSSRSSWVVGLWQVGADYHVFH